MSDTKLLQAILNGQTIIRDDIKNLDNKLFQQIKNNTQRLDKIGTQLAYIEDDSPTREEFDELTKDVTNLKTASSISLNHETLNLVSFLRRQESLFNKNSPGEDLKQY